MFHVQGLVQVKITPMRLKIFYFKNAVRVCLMCNTQYQGCEINLSQLKISAVPEAKSVCVAAGKQAREFDQMCVKISFGEFL
jgi:hypothetical protein